MAYFDIGKKVIAIRNHPDMMYKSGQVYTLLNIRTSLCKCADPLLDIGFKNRYRYWICDICEASGRVEDSIFWVSSVDFLPYDDSLSDITVEEIMDEIEEYEELLHTNHHHDH
jgi:hypothetical protein